jgi:predicted transcriptional regulator
VPHTTITLRSDPELAGKITAIASAMERSRDFLIQEALKQDVEVQAWQIEGIKAAIASLDKEEGIPHEQVMFEADALLDALDVTP